MPQQVWALEKVYKLICCVKKVCKPIFQITVADFRGFGMGLILTYLKSVLALHPLAAQTEQLLFSETALSLLKLRGWSTWHPNCYVVCHWTGSCCFSMAKGPNPLTNSVISAAGSFFVA